MIEIRSVEGRLLAKVAEDGSMLEIVQRRQRYVWQRGWAVAVHAVIVAYVEEDEGQGQGQREEGQDVDAARRE
jgi:hypothetical protein